MDDSLNGGKQPPEEVASPNTQQPTLADTTSWSAKCIALMQSGVTITDPNTTSIDDAVEVGQDTTILPGCTLQGMTRIGSDCQIGPNVTIINSQIGSSTRVGNSTRIENMTIGANVTIDPFQRLIGPEK